MTTKPLPDCVKEAEDFALSMQRSEIEEYGHDLAESSTILELVGIIRAQATALAERDARIEELEAEVERQCMDGRPVSTRAESAEQELQNLRAEYYRQGKEDGKAEAERDELKAKLARVLEFMRGRCVCCSKNTCAYYGGNRVFNCQDWTPPAGLGLGEGE